MATPPTPTASAIHPQAVVAEFDPLASPGPSSSTDSTPLTFKRRTASRSLASRAGLLGGILSRGDNEEDRVPAPILQRPDAPTRIALPLRDPMASSDDEDEPQLPGGKLSTTPSQTQGGRWPQRLRAVSNASRGNRAGGGGAMRSPRVSGKWDQNPYSPGGRQRLLSPGGGGGGGGARTPDDEQDEPQLTEPTPLPTLSILVLCIAMFGAAVQSYPCAHELT